MGSVKLLDKTLRPFTVYALLILALSIPVYYVIVDYIWVNELDKHHRSVKGKVEQEINALDISDDALQQTLSVWNTVNPGSTFWPADASEIRADSAYTVLRFDDFHQDREQFRGLVTYIHIHGKPYRMVVETNMEETDETILAIAGVTVLFFLLLLTGFIILNRKLSLRIWKPFYRVLDSLRNFDLEGGEKPAFAPSDIREFGELNAALEKLIEKNISVFSRQREFTENASHELQTPLAVIRSQLDMLLQGEPLTEKQHETVEALQRTLTRAYRINKNLLLLARIENSRQFFDTGEIDPGAMVEELLETLREHMDDKHLYIELHIAPGIRIKGNRALAEVLVNNLLLNAVRHTALGGGVSVTLTADAFTVSNSGASALDAGSLFRRFISASRETSGSGLGLAIVRQVAQRSGWTVGYLFTGGRHVFTVRFKPDGE